MFRDFAAFLSALWRQWMVLLTGGTIAAVLSLWGLTGHKPPSQEPNWLIIGLTLILAAFFAWRKEWIEAGGGQTTIPPSDFDEADEREKQSYRTRL